MREATRSVLHLLAEFALNSLNPEELPRERTQAFVFRLALGEQSNAPAESSASAGANVRPEQI